MIRLCPLPYSYSNFFFASIPSVSLPQFFLASCALAPKLFLAVFIGNRLYLFSDPDHRDHMDNTSKILNSISVVVAVLLGLGVVSSYIAICLSSRLRATFTGHVRLSPNDEIRCSRLGG